MAERVHSYNLDEAARIVQLALTPVFLLSSTATLLGVFAVRLARVADRVHVLSEKERGHNQEELRLLRRRSRVLDVAVVLAALGGGLVGLPAHPS